VCSIAGRDKSKRVSVYIFYSIYMCLCVYINTKRKERKIEARWPQTQPSTKTEKGRETEAKQTNY